MLTGAGIAGISPWRVPERELGSARDRLVLLFLGLWVYLLAYNLIRLLMAQAALLADQIPRQLSFKHTVQLWISWQSRGGGTHDAVCIHALLVLIAEPRVGLRPGRIEPRALKRRLKSYPLLTKPRRLAQEEVRQNGHPKKQR